MELASHPFILLLIFFSNFPLLASSVTAGYGRFVCHRRLLHLPKELRPALVLCISPR